MTDQAAATRRANVRLVQATDPSARASSVAAELGGDVVADLRAAEREVRTRVDAGRRSLGDEAADRDLLLRADAVRAAAAEPAPISAEQTAEIERLAQDLGRAARIRQRTEARFADSLQAKLAASMGVAIHPDAIRAAAKGVADAEELVASADEALGMLGDHPPRSEPLLAPPAAPKRSRLPHAPWHFDHGEGEDPVLQRPHDVFDELALDKRRATTRGLVIFVLVAVIGIVAIALGQSTIGAVLLAAAGGAGLYFGIKGHREAVAEDRSRVDAAARIDGFVAPSLASVPEPEPVPSPPDAEAIAAEAQAARVEHWNRRRNELLAERAEAAERVRLATSRWHQLTGPDTDPHDPDPVIRANDPQLHYDPHVAEDSPTIRTVAAFHRSLQARWRILWASLGTPDTPEPDDYGAALQSVLGPGEAAAEELREQTAAEEREAARAVVRRPLVLVEPRTWISDGRLAQLLSSIPPGGQAVVVERATPQPGDSDGEPDAGEDDGEDDEVG
jgi:hypothetical protein